MIQRKNKIPIFWHLEAVNQMLVTYAQWKNESVIWESKWVMSTSLLWVTLVYYMIWKSISQTNFLLCYSFISSPLLHNYSCGMTRSLNHFENYLHDDIFMWGTKPTIQSHNFSAWLNWESFCYQVPSIR